MEESLKNEQSIGITPTTESKGCSGLAAIIVLSIWVLFLTFIVQLTNFTIFQIIFEGSIKVPNIRWIIELTYGLLLFIPFLIAEKVVREPVAQKRLQALRNISILAILLTPSRLSSITDWQLTASIQLAGVCVFLVLWLVFFHKHQKNKQDEKTNGLNLLAISAGAGAIVGIPWVLWGAQGSPLDSILALLLSTGLGIITVSVLLPEITSIGSDRTSIKQSIGGAGWIITLGLIILTTAIDQNNNGWILLFSLLPLGFAAASLAIDMDGYLSMSGRLAAGTVVLLGFAWPMMMIDPDELSAVVSGEAGELLGYAVEATAIGFGLALLLFIFLLVSRKFAGRKEISPIPGAVFFVAAWTLVLVLYGTFGHPGFYGEKIFVIMKSQADLTTEKNIPDALARRKAVYSALVQNAVESQKDIRAWLDSKGIAYQPYYLVNAIELDGNPILRQELAARSDVDRILDSPVLRPLQSPAPVSKGEITQEPSLPWNIQMIGADRVHKDFKVYGEGIIIGQSDSGADGQHSQLSANYRGNLDGTDNFNWFDPWFGSKKPVDIGGHGTHTLGSIVGETVGVAPKAEWIGCVNLARNLGNPAHYLDCMQFMLAPFPQNGDPFKDGKPEKGANVLNNSWGCPVVEGCDPKTYLPAVSALKTAGIFVVASAGNSGMGGCSTVQDPLAIYEDVYSVGAVDRNGNIASFSSLGPVEVDGSGRIKPDIAAPGVDVISSYPGSTYKTASGTSMAGPHVAGVVALLWSANPKLIGDIEKTREILNETADPYNGVVPECVTRMDAPNSVAGYGIVNAYKAVEKALEDR